MNLLLVLAAGSVGFKVSHGAPVSSGLLSHTYGDYQPRRKAGE